jgi:hypothetical protein
VLLLRAFWEWVGRYSVRDLEAWSVGAFSRTTVADRLPEAPRKRADRTLTRDVAAGFEREPAATSVPGRADGPGNGVGDDGSAQPISAC